MLPVRRYFTILSTSALVVMLTACETIKRHTPKMDFSWVPEVSMPKLPPLPKFSSLKKITSILPGMPDSDKANEEDPKMPFNARGTLGYGHTLRIHVYEGSRSTKRIYNGVVMVDSKGLLDFGRAGQARVGGTQLPQAAQNIMATFRTSLGIARQVTVHILSVEDVPLVSVSGDVTKEEFVPAYEGMTIQQAVAIAGGRRAGSQARTVYLAREGQRRYYPSLETADQDEPEPGDIIILSPDL